MPQLNIAVSHNLTQETALKRIKDHLEALKIQFADKITDLREEWDGNRGQFSFSAMSYSVSGVLTVKPSEVEISGDLPFFVATLFKLKKIEPMIRTRLETLLAP